MDGLGIVNVCKKENLSEWNFSKSNFGLSAETMGTKGML